MIYDVCNLHTHTNYVVDEKEDKIGYKLSDHSLCFKTTYSYLTTFAYFKEQENNTISK